MTVPHPAIEALPEPLRPRCAEVFGRLRDAVPELAEALYGPLCRVLASSAWASETLERHPALLSALIADGSLGRDQAPGELRAQVLADAAPTLAEADFLRQLRLVRHRQLVRIIWRDLNGSAPPETTLADLSELADAAIVAALDWARHTLAPRHGEPRCADGTPCGFGVIGMGKLGGRELNFSSDIDLVFIYTDYGETDGPRPLSNEEYFRLLAQRLIDALGRCTADGFVYRVDVRLRPFGSAGPLAVSLPAFESYLVRHGRDWERYAYVKARVISEWDQAGTLYRDVLRPFVYRRYLDYGVFASLREMKALIAAEVRNKAYHHNLKLGPGGIREIEFIVQTLQLVRGGTLADLREPSLLAVLPRLVHHQCLPQGHADELAAAYRYLRLAENRLQAIADRQTHDLPTASLDRARLLHAMGVADWQAFEHDLKAHQAAVSRHFHDVVFRGAGEREAPATGEGLAAVWTGALDADEAAAVLAAAGFADAGATLERLRRLREGGALRRLGEVGRQRLDQLVPAVLASAARQPAALQAIDGMALILEAIGRRSAYFALLNENPAALERLVRLCAHSMMLAQQVAAHPLLLDELLDPRIFSAPPDRAELGGDLAARLGRAGTEDIEQQLDALRNFQQAAIFRVAVVDLSGLLPLMKVSDRLTDIAELTLGAALDIAWRELAARHGAPFCTVDGRRRPARFAIVAYGKLGGLELGYGSDLDLVFLHDSAGEAEHCDGPQPLDNAVFFARLTRRILSILTMPTSSGKLYEVDIRLRPSGRSGLLVSSLAAFERYQQEEAWTWEHQALLRSRAVAGDAAVGQAFEVLRVQALTHWVRHENLCEAVADMRRRMRVELATGTPELMDLKQDPGGISDIEFIVQYLVLREARHHPDLVRWPDNIRQLEGLAGHGILAPADAEALAEAYRSYRVQIHHRSLAGQPALLPRAEVAALVATVMRLWTAVFGAPPEGRPDAPATL